MHNYLKLEPYACILLTCLVLLTTNWKKAKIMQRSDEDDET